MHFKRHLSTEDLQDVKAAALSSVLIFLRQRKHPNLQHRSKVAEPLGILLSSVSHRRLTGLCSRPSFPVLTTSLGLFAHITSPISTMLMNLLVICDRSHKPSTQTKVQSAFAEDYFQWRIVQQTDGVYH